MPVLTLMSFGVPPLRLPPAAAAPAAAPPPAQKSAPAPARSPPPVGVAPTGPQLANRAGSSDPAAGSARGKGGLL